MAKIVEIPKKEIKDKRLLVQVTRREHKEIMQYCKAQKRTLSELVRYSLKQTFDFDV